MIILENNRTKTISNMCECDYSVYDKKSSHLFSISNPKPRRKTNDGNTICFKIILLKRRSFKIVICKDNSLEDLYIQIYNAVYPEFSTEKKFDEIPPPTVSGYSKIPKIYNVSTLDKNENINFIPVHRIITISSYMKSKPDCFNNISFMGIPTYRIYAMDEKTLIETKNSLMINNNNKPTYLQKLISCVYK